MVSAQKDRLHNSSLHLNTESGTWENKIVCFLKYPRGALMPKKGRAVLCRNWEHSEELIKIFLLDYTLKVENSFLSCLSLTQLAQEECKGWVGSSPTWEWKEATYRKDDSVRNAAAVNSTSTLCDNCLAIFQRQRQLTGKVEKKMHLTTSLSGSLDKSGAHFKVAFVAERYVALQTSVPAFPEPKRAFQGIWQETWIFGYNTCSSQVYYLCQFYQKSSSWELHPEFPLPLFITNAWKCSVLLMNF